MKNHMGRNSDIESLILLSMMKDRGFNYLSKNIPLTELFIVTNADAVNDSSVWRNLLLNQNHINPSFFDQFHGDMDDITQSMLVRKKLMFKIIRLIRRG